MLLAAAVVLTYANSLSGAFVLDDQAAVVQNFGIRDLSRLSAVLVPSPDSPVAGRPLVNLSFALNYAVGGLDVRGYHVFNIGFHLVCALLAFTFIRLTLELPRVRDRVAGHATPLAFAIALLWAVHPLNSEVVDYLSQRTESMMAACYLLTLVAAVRAAASTRAAGWQALAVGACALGMLCKESMATAPLLVVLYDRVFLFDSWRQAWGRRRTLYPGLAATWLVLGAILASSPRAGVAGFGSGVSTWTYLLNQTAMITEYLRLAVWPRSLVAFYGWPAPLSLADVIPQALLVVGLLLATVVALIRVPPAGFPGAWFFITLAPTSSIVPIATEVGAERRMYLPLLAVVAVAVMGIRLSSVAATRWRTGPRAHVPARVAAAVFGVVAAMLAATTMVRNREYASGLTLARTIVERRPTAVAYHMLGEQLSQAGQPDEAIDRLREAVRRGNSRAGYLLGVVLFNQGRTKESIERLDAFVRTAGVPQVPRWLEPPLDEILRARLVLGLAYLREGAFARAEEQAMGILAVAPRSVDGRGLLANALFGQERWTDAAREYRVYLAARPNDVQGLLNFGVSLVGSERLDDALPVFRRAVAIDPSDANAKRLLALAEADSAR